MQCLSLKKGIAWDILGKMLLIFLFLLIALAILGMIIARTVGLAKIIESIFG